jgi:hypothetical protein
METINEPSKDENKDYDVIVSYDELQEIGAQMLNVLNNIITPINGILSDFGMLQRKTQIIRNMIDFNKIQDMKQQDQELYGKLYIYSELLNDEVFKRVEDIICGAMVYKTMMYDDFENMRFDKMKEPDYFEKLKSVTITMEKYIEQLKTNYSHFIEIWVCVQSETDYHEYIKHN